MNYITNIGISPRARIAELKCASRQRKGSRGSNQSFLQTSSNFDQIPNTFRQKENQLRINNRLTRKIDRGFPPKLSLNSTLKINTSFNRIDPHDNRKQAWSTPRAASNRSQAPFDPQAIFDSLSKPLSPDTIRQKFLKFLTIIEQSEIQEYNEIYYIGLSAVKMRPNLRINNHGFDDERCDYKLIKGDHIAYRYEIIQMIGKGSFGQVVKCLDHKSGQQIALKILRNEKRFHRQGRVEVKILKYMNKQEDKAKNVIPITNYFVFRNHLCLTFPLLNQNLYQLLKLNNFKGITMPLIKKFAMQLLTCLKFLRNHHIIHCDLKPENILLQSSVKSNITIIDFGSACFEHQKLYTYIQSRFYRAPEIILGIPYTMSIDMWSLGCIIAELFLGYPLLPGQSESDQLNYILEFTGVPSQKIMDQSTRKESFFNAKNQLKKPVNQKGQRRYPGTKTLSNILKCNDKMFLEFVQSNFQTDCLILDPEQRWTPEEALQHIWLNDMQEEAFRITARNLRMQ